MDTILGLDTHLNSIVLIESNSPRLFHWVVKSQLHISDEAISKEIAIQIGEDSLYIVSDQLIVDQLPIAAGVAERIEHAVHRSSCVECSWKTVINATLAEQRR